MLERIYTKILPVVCLIGSECENPDDIFSVLVILLYTRIIRSGYVYCGYTELLSLIELKNFTEAVLMMLMTRKLYLRPYKRILVRMILLRK